MMWYLFQVPIKIKCEHEMGSFGLPKYSDFLHPCGIKAARVEKMGATRDKMAALISCP